MKIVLATGIYPPQIGGPATYVRRLAQALTAAGHTVTVVSYAPAEQGDGFAVVPVHLGLPVVRWFAYARALRRCTQDAAVVYAFSSVSVGVPMWLARIFGRCPTVLRLGGDFAWERATDRGDQRSLREWYADRPWRARLLGPLLRRFSHIVFSTDFQRTLAHAAYGALPCSVIENPVDGTLAPSLHSTHMPVRLLFLGRFVRFKNLPALIEAVPLLPQVRLTVAGDGPDVHRVRERILQLGLQDRVVLQPPVAGIDKAALFATHDLLVLPSLTEISPNVALEARSAGLPVLLTEETGLSAPLLPGIALAPLRTSEQIASAVTKILADYSALSTAAASFVAPAPAAWPAVAAEHVSLFSRL